jgi:hypothetical protein
MVDPRIIDGIVNPRADVLPVQMNRQRVYTITQVSWRELPPSLRDLDMNSDVGWAPRMYLAGLYLRLGNEPGQPRDEMLRGRFDQAAHELGQMRERLPEFKQHVESHPELTQDVIAWAKQAKDAWSDYLKAKDGGVGSVDAANAEVRRVMKDGEPKWRILLEGVTATSRKASVTYLLALCEHEKAERLAAQMRQLNDASDKQQRQAELRDTWLTTASWWETYLSETPSVTAEAASARGLYARCREALGDASAAIEQWENPAGVPTDLEKAARLYQAKQLKATSRK